MRMKRKRGRPPKTRALTLAESQKLGELVNAPENMHRALLSMRELAADSLRIFIPVPELAYGVSVCGKYNAEMHAKVCRLKFLGLSDAATARALRISPETLNKWRDRYPQLACDMETAKELANAHAADGLKRLMDADGPTAFNAIRFYLTTHSPEFREPTAVPPAADINVTIQQIRQQIFGLPPQRGSTPFESPKTIEPEKIEAVTPEQLTMDDL